MNRSVAVTAAFMNNDEQRLDTPARYSRQFSTFYRELRKSLGLLSYRRCLWRVTVIRMCGVVGV